MSLKKIRPKLCFQNRVLVGFEFVCDGLGKIGWQWIVRKHLITSELNKNGFGKKKFGRIQKLGQDFSRKILSVFKIGSWLI